MTQSEQQELNALREENARLKKQCESLEVKFGNFAREAFLIELMSENNYSPEEYADALKEYSLDMPSDRFAVMCISLDTDFSALFDDSLPAGQEQVRYSRFLIRNVTEELTGEKNRCQVIIIHGKLVALINLLEPDEAALASIARAAQTASDVLEQHYEAVVSFSISRAHTGYRAIPKAYQEALQLESFRAMTGDESRVLQYDMRTEANIPNERIEHFDFEHKLGSCLRAGDYETARELVHTMLNAEFNHSQPTVQIFMVRAYGLINDILHVFDSLEESFSIEFLMELQAGPRIVHASSISEISQELDSIFDAIIAKQQEQEPEPQWVQRAVDYIDQNFTDQNLNVTNVAEAVGINPVYLSRMLKKYRGIRPLEYIHEKRIEKAKELLSHGVTVKDTLPQVGYTSALTMNRAFRKFENTTPGAFYREK